MATEALSRREFQATLKAVSGKLNKKIAELKELKTEIDKLITKVPPGGQGSVKKANRVAGAAERAAAPGGGTSVKKANR